jgi:PAS domain S-box-containing protein
MARRISAPEYVMDRFFALSPDPMCVTTLEGLIGRVNPAFVHTTGYSEAHLLASNMLDLLHPQDRPAGEAAIAGLSEGNAIAGLESRFSCAGGSHKWLAWSSTPFPAEGLAYTVAHDLTQLRQAETHWVGVLESTTDAVLSVDREWRLIRVNQQAERLWLRRREDLLGRNLWEVFPEAVGGPFFRMYEQVMRTGAPGYLEEFYPHAPLNRWFETHAYATPEGLAVYFRDVTDRRQAEEKITRTLQEKEVLLREVHHRVKNNLQVICSMLRLQERNLRDDTLLDALRECRERVMAMAMLHDQLHRAKDFSNINLGEYIRNLAASIFCSYGVNSAEINLRLDVEDMPVAIDTAIPCGLLVNELVSNSLRHAFPAGRRGFVELGLHARPGGSIELTVADDGRGFPENAQAAHGRSLGLWLVELLAEQIGAAVERSIGGGTRYRLVFHESVAS